MSTTIPFAENPDRARTRAVEQLADGVINAKMQSDHDTTALTLAETALNTLDIDAGELLDEADKLRPRTVMLIMMIVLVMFQDQRFLSAFARMIADLSGTAASSLFWIASVVSLVLTGADVGVGLLFPRRAVSRQMAYGRAAIIGSLLAVPAIISWATCVAGWADVNGVMPPEKLVVSVAMVALTVAAHAVVIALASSGVGPWVYYRAARMFRVVGLRDLTEKQLESRKELDRRMVRFLLEVGEAKAEKLRDFIFNRAPSKGVPTQTELFSELGIN
ncbi:MAG TPA: hypothetical protein VN706_12405 [Gemmatimonadaceae bacterium]|nr:hypothetical protein [Gemmatimonadaceae bacterium]